MKSYLVVISLLVYMILATISLLPEVSILQVFQKWVLGDVSRFSYSNFYWVFSYVIMVIIHQSHVTMNQSHNLIMLLVLCSFLALMTIISAFTSKVDDHILRTPSIFIGVVMISSTLMNNYSLKTFDRKCQLVSFMDLDDKNLVDFFHTIVFVAGLGVSYAIISR